MSVLVNKENKNHYDIIVVGAGLVGATFAALLVKKIGCQQQSNGKNLRIALVDGGTVSPIRSMDTECPDFDPRVVALTEASQCLFKYLDLWDIVRTKRACQYTQMHVWDDDGTASIHFNASDIQRQQLGYIVENSILQCTVMDFIEQQKNISIFRRTKATTLSISNEISSIICQDGSSISANLIVAADGAESKMRQLSEIQVRKWSYKGKAIVATVESSKSHQFTAWQNFLSSGTLAFLPLEHPSERYCSIVWSLDSDNADAMMALNDADFSQVLARAFEYRLGDVKSVSPRFCFPLQQQNALEYSRANVVLIGDAAHTVYPLAGQGVNLGLLDAEVLANELKRACIRGLVINETSVLRRYQRQRKRNNLEMMLFMEGLKRLFGSEKLWVRWLRNIGLRKVNELTLFKSWLARQAIKYND